MPLVHVSDALAVRCPRKRSARAAAAIYALVDKRDDLVRYVGKTTGELPHRLAWHFKAPTNAAMATWLGNAGKANARIVVLEYVELREWEDAERGWIRWFQERGQLLNVDPGGRYRDRDGRPLGVKLGQFEAPVAAERESRAGDLWTRLHRPMRRANRSGTRPRR